jgi:hypothetical protein
VNDNKNTSIAPAGIDLDKLNRIERAATMFRDICAFHPGHFQQLKNFANDALELAALARRAAADAPAATLDVKYEFEKWASNRGEAAIYIGNGLYHSGAITDQAEAFAAGVEMARLALAQQPSHSAAAVVAVDDLSYLLEYIPVGAAREEAKRKLAALSANALTDQPSGAICQPAQAEAVAAMERAKKLPVWDDINRDLHKELDIIFRALSMAASPAPAVQAVDARTDDERVAVQFYRDNPRAALFDMNQRIAKNASPAAAPEAAPVLLAEILALAESGMCQGLVADDYCSQIVAKIKAAPEAAHADDFEAWARKKIGMPVDMPFVWDADWAKAALEGWNGHAAHAQQDAAQPDGDPWTLGFEAGKRVGAQLAAVSPTDATGKAETLDALQKAAKLLRAAGFCMTGTASSQIVAAINAHSDATGKADAASAGGLYSPEAVDMLNRLQMRLTAMLGDEFHNVESMLERICSILAAPAFPEKIEMFRLGDTLQVRREKRTDGRSGWLLYDETDRLVSALSRSECGLIDAAIAAQMANIPPATSAADAMDAEQWTKTPPTEQADYWNWDGDPDHAPMIYHVLWSGTAKKCFVSIGQYGIENAIWCDEFGGWWLKIEQPSIPSGDAAMAASRKDGA